MAVFNGFWGSDIGFLRGNEYLGRYAVSLAGHDAGKIYLLIGVECGARSASQTMLLLCDGRARKAASPKRKKAMHVRVLASRDDAIAYKLIAGESVTDAELVHSIKCFKAGQGQCPDPLRGGDAKSC